MLIERLEDKGMKINNIPRFFTNITNILSFVPQGNINELKNWVHLLGWNKVDLDDSMVQLIITSLEAEGFMNQGSGADTAADH